MRDGLAAPDQGAWFLPGRHGAFVGPRDEYFVILPAASATLRFYLTAAFRGRSAPAFTIDLGSPAPGGAFGAGPALLAGPPAPGAPREGAEAAAERARKAKERRERKAKEEEEKRKEGASAAEGAADGGAAEGAAAAAAAKEAKPQALLRAERAIAAADSSDDDGEADSMIPVVGIGAAYQPSAQRGGGGGGVHRGAHASGFSWQQRPGGGFTFTAIEAAAAPRSAAAAGPLSGGGAVMWHTADGRLAMAGLPAPPAAVQYAAGSDSDDPDGEAAGGGAAAPQAPDMGELQPEHTLELQPGERALSVAWQNLEARVPLEPARTAAALLTTRRLLIVAGDLRVIAEAPAAGAAGAAGCAGAPHAVTSFAWAGPALLFCTAAGQVMQLTWTGEVHHVASVAAQPPPVLIGALADSLLLLRRPSGGGGGGGEPEVATRAVNMLQPLVLGWCSLAASGLLPRLGSARAAIQQALAAFDATTVTSATLWTLLNSCCWDVAAALAAHAAFVDEAAATAANAAAGRWPAVLSALLAEAERSVYHPRPPPPGAALHSKLLAGAAGAMMHGQFGPAREMLAAAGEWETALAVAVCQGDFGALRDLAGMEPAAAAADGAADFALPGAPVSAPVAPVASGPIELGLDEVAAAPIIDDDDIFGLGSLATGASATGAGPTGGGVAAAAAAPPPRKRTGGSASGPWARALAGLSEQERADLARLARALVSAHERSAARAAAVGGGPTGGGGGAGGAPEDWKLRPVMGDLSFFSDASGWSFGGQGTLPAMEASAFNAPSRFVQDGEVGPIPRAEAGTLGVYLGLSDLTDTTSAEARARARGGRERERDASSDGGASDIDQLLALGAPDGSFGGGGAGARRSGSAASSFDEGSRGGTPLPEDFFELLSGGGGAAAGKEGEAAGGGDGLDGEGGGQQRIRIQLPGATEPGAAPGGADGQAAAGATGGVGGGDSFSALDALVDEELGGGSAGGAGAAGTSTSARPAAPKPPRAPGGAPGLGGPAMRPKAPKAAAAAPISDEDFFSALAPALGGAGAGGLGGLPTLGGGGGGGGGSSGLGMMSAGPPPPPPAAAKAAPQPSAGRGGGSGGSKAAPSAPGGLLRPPPAAPLTGGPDELHARGVASMEAGDWQAAADAFAAALAAAPADAPRARAAQYLAAVLLLRAAADDASARGARLYRFAAALKLLDARHAIALVREGVVRNKHVGNFRYAAEQLTWLITQSLGSAPMHVMAQLQEDIDACDRRGGRDAALPAGERCEDFAGIVAAARAARDVEEAVAPLLAAGAGG